MGSILGQRAVVIGGGIGGLSAAGALAGFFEQVDVLERDNLTQSIGSRAGTPQDRHSHGLLAGGLVAIGAIYPNLERDLERAGAVRVRVGQDLCYERADVGALPRRDLGRSLLCATRPLIEYVVRQQMQALANVTLRSGVRVIGIISHAPHSSQPSVRFDDKSGHTETRTADLVVDASGRGTLTLALLGGLGWTAPQVTEVGVDLCYATVVVNIPPDAQTGCGLTVTMPDPPGLARHAVLIPVEGNRWTITVADHGATSPRSWEDFLEALRGLATPTIYNALRHAERPDGVRTFAFRASQWRHFDRLPRGVLPIADALCRFNPIYGQGMSSAGQQARLLRDVLNQSAAEADPIAVAEARFMTEVATVLQTPWAMSTGADFAFPATRGVRPENFEEAERFEASLFRAAVVDPVVHRNLMDVAQLLQPDSVLQEPDIQRRVEAASARAEA